MGSPPNGGKRADCFEHVKKIRGRSGLDGTVFGRNRHRRQDNNDVKRGQIQPGGSEPLTGGVFWRQAGWKRHDNRGNVSSPAVPSRTPLVATLHCQLCPSGRRQAATVALTRADPQPTPPDPDFSRSESGLRRRGNMFSLKTA